MQAYSADTELAVLLIQISVFLDGSINTWVTYSGWSGIVPG